MDSSATGDRFVGGTTAHGTHDVRPSYCARLICACSSVVAAVFRRQYRMKSSRTLERLVTRRLDSWADPPPPRRNSGRRTARRIGLCARRGDRCGSLHTWARVPAWALSSASPHLRPRAFHCVQLRLELAHAFKLDALFVVELFKIRRDAADDARQAFKGFNEPSGVVGGTRPTRFPRGHSTTSLPQTVELCRVSCLLFV